MFTKTTLLIILFTLATLNLCAQQFEQRAALTGVTNGSTAWGDYDNDGDLDILLTGLNENGNPISKVYQLIALNINGDPIYTVPATLTGVHSGSSAWGDYDNDGNLDILLTGLKANGNAVSQIYRNNGAPNYTFTETSISLTGVSSSSVAWGDYDNDGDLDILLTGTDGSTLVSKIYRNDAEPNYEFTETSISLTGVSSGSIAWGDYDNDGDLDILLTGHAGIIAVSKIYNNNGNNSFTEIPTSIDSVRQSSAAWGDYDNDGYLDILLTGKNNLTVPPFFNNGVPISSIYHNNGDGTFSYTAAMEGVVSGSAAWGDYDNDGDLDVLLTGFTDEYDNDPSTSTNTPIKKSAIYRNNGDNTFQEITTSLIDVFQSSIAWGDYDNDGDLDILLTGESDGRSQYQLIGGTTYYSNPISKIYRNNNVTPNTLPGMPLNLSSSISGNDVTFSWDKSTDTETPQNGLKYNLVIGTSPGAINALSPMSDRSTGYRRVVNLGNINHNNSWTIKDLPYGQYYWSVQAIDNAFAGSDFSTEQTFAVNNQVHTGNLTLTQQSAVNDFNYTEVTGNLLISGTDILSLAGLSELTSVGGSLTIFNSPVTDISGLSNLTTVGENLDISLNNALTNIDGLPALTSVGINLIIQSNSLLNNITGLPNLTSVGGDLGIQFNPSLSNISGLTSLTSVGGFFYIRNNDALTNINGLPNLGSITLGFIIENNHALTNIDGLSGLASIGGLNIQNNTLLSNISGLSNLSSLSSLRIIDNASLTNVNGLSNLSSTIELSILNNPALTNIDGLSNITGVGSLFLNNNDALPNIDGLSGLTSIGYYLQITDNASLTNIDGLSNIISVVDLFIDNNDALTNIDGLSSLASIGNYLQITENATLTNIDGLSAISSIGTDLYIYNNLLLNSIAGLSSLSSVSNLSIINNASLSNVNGLSSLTSITGTLSVQSNAALINIDGLSNFTSAYSIDISGNASLTNIDGLSNLASVTSDLTIINNTTLSEFCGLYYLFYINGLGGNYVVSGNATTPTQQSIVNNGPCQSSANHFTSVWTGNPYQAMNIYVTSATVDGVDLGAGDEIAVFDGDYCVGTVQLTGAIPSGGYVSIITSTDDPTTMEIDGFTPGNAITFKFWDLDRAAVIYRMTLTYTLGAGNFSPLETAVVDLAGVYTIDQVVQLTTGWNIFSLAAQLVNPNMLQLLNPLFDQLIKVQDENGNAIEQLPPPIGWINNIGNWTSTEGYYVKVSADATLSVTDPPVAFPLNIPLETGWNIIGYPVISPQDALAAFDDLITANQLIKVQDENGDAIEYLPVPINNWVNNIGDLEPGEGYYIKVNANTSLAINQSSNRMFATNYKSENKNTLLKPSSNHFQPVYTSNPYLAMNIYVTSADLVEGGSLHAGDEIGIFDGSYCVGSKVLTAPINAGSPLSMVVSTDDPTTTETDGFTSGHNISYKFWLSSISTEISNYTASYTTGNGFSDGIFASQGTALVGFTNVLPVELTSFTADVEDNKVKLYWETATEINNYGFDVERQISSNQHSSDNWEKIGFVNGSGNSNNAQSYQFTDKNLFGGSKFSYRLKQIDADGSFKYSDEIELEIIPIKYELLQNYPNPFNPSTIITWQLPMDSHITLKVYDVLGNEIATLVNEEKNAGVYEVEFSASSISSGVYFYRIEATPNRGQTGDFIQMKKMILLR